LGTDSFDVCKTSSTNGHIHGRTAQLLPVSVLVELVATSWKKIYSFADWNPPFSAQPPIYGFIPDLLSHRELKEHISKLLLKPIQVVVSIVSPSAAMVNKAETILFRP